MFVRWTRGGTDGSGGKTWSGDICASEGLKEYESAEEMRAASQSALHCIRADNSEMLLTSPPPGFQL